MRNIGLAIVIAAAVGAPLYAADGQQSYFTYDDGGTVVRQGTDGQEADARVNYPLFAGDEITTNRRGRSEIRLSDGNIIALDRSTSLTLRSILDSYESDDAQTVAELSYGHVVVQRTDAHDEPLRLDTPNASYVASEEAFYAVETDARGKDHVTVFDGEIEVRTPKRDSRLSAGHEAHIDDAGVYGLVSESRPSTDEFERWFIQRAERYRGSSSRYLDRSIAYSDSDLEANGSWVYSNSLGTWCWRPNVAASWRPYYQGYWHHSPGGTLLWVSEESWGWVPYHYGRWANDPLYGWIWLPGTGYAPAWVYWMYGADYVGWAPAGWYDCYRPYYGWAYRPYARAGIDIGFGFYGRVRVGDIDLRPWTFVSPGTLITRRVDRASLTIDAVRERLTRGGANGIFATVSGTPARFNRNELRDPAQAIANISRRGFGGARSGAGGSTSDMTPFFRRDAQLSRDVQERIVRNRPVDPGRGSTSAGGNRSGGATAGEGRVSRGGAGRRGETPAAGGVAIVTPVDARGAEGLHRGTPGSSTFPDDGIGRGSLHRDQPGAEIPRGNVLPSTERDATTTVWRSRPSQPSTRTQPAAPERSTIAPPVERSTERPAANDSWRRRAVGGEVPRSIDTPRSAPAPSSGGDVPRRVIDGIGGARIHRDRDPGRATSGDAGRATVQPRPSAPPPPPQQQRQAPPPHASETPRSSDNGGRVHRDRQ